MRGKEKEMDGGKMKRGGESTLLYCYKEIFTQGRWGRLIKNNCSFSCRELKHARARARNDAYSRVRRNNRSISLTFMGQKTGASKWLMIVVMMVIFRVMITLQKVITESKVKLKIQGTAIYVIHYCWWCHSAASSLNQLVRQGISPLTYTYI